MEDVKWMFRKCEFPILIFLFVVIVGTVCWEKLKTEKPQSVTLLLLTRVSVPRT